MINKKLISVQDFKEVAKTKLNPAAWGYFDAGADSCSTKYRNEEEFSNVKLRQRVLQGRLVEKFDMSTEIFGKKISSPICIGPAAMQGLAHPDAEIPVMKAAQKRNTAYSLSSLSNVVLEEAAKNAPSVPKLMQLYCFKTLEKNEKFIRRVEAAGFDGLAITVDTPIFGFRRADIYNNFSLPPHLKYSNIDMAYLQNMKQSPPKQGEGFLDHYFRTNHELEIGWDNIKAIRKITKLKIIIKGVLCAEDAAICGKYAKEGIIDGVWVSNHGGRQLDQTISTIEALPQIVRHLKGIVPIWFDGGVRKGTDALKALALGADLVFVARPIVWGLAALGQEGVEGVLNVLDDQLKRAMILAGVSNIKEIRSKKIIYRQVPKL